MHEFQLSGRSLPKEYAVEFFEAFRDTIGVAGTRQLIVLTIKQIEEQFDTSSLPKDWQNQLRHYMPMFTGSVAVNYAYIRYLISVFYQLYRDQNPRKFLMRTLRFWFRKEFDYRSGPYRIHIWIQDEYVPIPLYYHVQLEQYLDHLAANSQQAHAITAFFHLLAVFKQNSEIDFVYTQLADHLQVSVNDCPFCLDRCQECLILETFFGFLIESVQELLPEPRLQLNLSKSAAHQYWIEFNA